MPVWMYGDFHVWSDTLPKQSYPRLHSITWKQPHRRDPALMDARELFFRQQEFRGAIVKWSGFPQRWEITWP